MERKKIFAVASIGGHWVQLLRIANQMEKNYEVVYLCTHPKCATMVNGKRFLLIEDFSRWNFYRLVPSFFKAIKLIAKEKPAAIISTGAAPGLMMLLAGKLLGKKTIWIDSVANVQHLSFSGRLASKFCSRIYTQWKDNAMKQVVYSGNIFG